MIATPQAPGARSMDTSDVEISKELAGRLTELVNEYFDQG
jgi:hypothetical protein